MSSLSARARRKSVNRSASLAERVTALDQAAQLANDRLSLEPVAFAEAIVCKANERLRHGTEHLLVGLLGATGSGKSSLCNAIVGSDIATTGVRRPTTSSTLACVWGSGDSGPLLDWLGVSNRHQVVATSNADSKSGSEPNSELDGLVLLDVPDHDSVEVAHRLEMEQIAEHADLLVWVTDPEKYADAAIHHYLRRLSHHGSAMVVVLNKSDQLNESEFRACRDDLIRLLDEDGVDGTPVVSTSATAPGGTDDLRGLLIRRVRSQASIMARLEADLAVAASDLLEEAADPEGSDRNGPAGISKKVATALAEDLTDAVGINTVSQAVVAGYRRDAIEQTGWPFTRWTQRLRPHPLRRLHLEKGTAGRSSRDPASAGQRTRALASIRKAADSASTGLPAPWPHLVRQAGVPDEDVLFDRLDHVVADAVRDVQPRKPLWWKLVGSVQLLLAIAAIVGAVWLLGLAGAAYLQIPALPTPTVKRIPVPTGLLIGGALLGWLLAMLSRVFASVGARRTGHAIRRDVAQAVRQVSSELILAPIETELAQRSQLISLLEQAGG